MILIVYLFVETNFKFMKNILIPRWKNAYDLSDINVYIILYNNIYTIFIIYI